MDSGLAGGLVIGPATSGRTRSAPAARAFPPCPGQQWSCGIWMVETEEREGVVNRIGALLAAADIGYFADAFGPDPDVAATASWLSVSRRRRFDHGEGNHETRRW